MVESPREVLERCFVALWAGRDTSVISEVRTEGSISNGLAPSAMVGVEPFRAFYERASALVTDTGVHFDTIVEQGDAVAALVTINGKIRGRPVAIQGSLVARIVDGRIVESRNLFDVAGLMKQLGDNVPCTLSEAFDIIEART